MKEEWKKKMEWVSLKDKLPPISYLESDNADDPYESYPVLVGSEEGPDVCKEGCRDGMD